MTEYVVSLTKDWQFEGFASKVRQLTATVEWVSPGSWLASWPVTHGAARRMFDSCAAGADPARWGMVLQARGQAVPAFSGIVQQVTYAYGQVQGYAADSIVASGYSDTGILGGTLAYPDPADDSTTGVHGWSVYVDGPSWPDAETAILDLIRDNLGSTAVARRRLPVLTVPASLGRGGPVTYSRRFPTLLEAVRDLCLTSGLSVRVDRTPGGLVVVVEEQVTNTAVSWSRRKNTLAGAAVTYKAATATSALVGGKRTTETDELSRVFLRLDRGAPAGGFAFPRERFVDDNGAATLDELASSGLKALVEGQPGPSVTVAPNTAVPYVLGVDYKVGDLTTVDASPPVVNREGGSLSPAAPPILARVDSVTVSVSGSSAWTTTPVIGEPTASPAALLRQLRREVRDQGKK